MSLTGYHEMLVEISSELVTHGWGSCIFKVTSLKDNTAKIEIECGKHYVFFIKKSEVLKDNII
jgi:hypothetical protein